MPLYCLAVLNYQNSNQYSLEYLYRQYWLEYLYSQHLQILMFDHKHCQYHHHQNLTQLVQCIQLLSAIQHCQRFHRYRHRYLDNLDYHYHPYLLDLRYFQCHRIQLGLDLHCLKYHHDQGLYHLLFHHYFYQYYYFN